MITNLFLLIFAHFLGDYPLQGDYLSMNKGKDWYCLFAHSVIWTGCVCIALQYLGLLSLWKIGFLFALHFLADKLKCMFPVRKKYLYIDQLFHFAQLLIVYFV